MASRKTASSDDEGVAKSGLVPGVKNGGRRTPSPGIGGVPQSLRQHDQADYTLHWCLERMCDAKEIPYGLFLEFIQSLDLESIPNFSMTPALKCRLILSGIKNLTDVTVDLVKSMAGLTALIRNEKFDIEDHLFDLLIPSDELILKIKTSLVIETWKNDPEVAFGDVVKEIHKVFQDIRNPDEQARFEELLKAAKDPEFRESVEETMQGFDAAEEVERYSREALAVLGPPLLCYIQDDINAGKYLPGRYVSPIVPPVVHDPNMLHFQDHTMQSHHQHQHQQVEDARFREYSMYNQQMQPEIPERPSPSGMGHFDLMLKVEGNDKRYIRNNFNPVGMDNMEFQGHLNDRFGARQTEQFMPRISEAPRAMKHNRAQRKLLEELTKTLTDPEKNHQSAAQILGSLKDSGFFDQEPGLEAVAPAKYSETKGKEIIHKRTERRRENRRWTEDEVNALKDGCRQFGVGSWSKILAYHWDRFNNRTQVDLKDKWRNLVRNNADEEASQIVVEFQKRKAAMNPGESPQENGSEQKKKKREKK